MGFKKATVFEFRGEPDESELLRITLRDGRVIYASPCFDNHPMYVTHVVRPEHMQPWLQEAYNDAIANARRDDPAMSPHMPQDYSEATGRWMVKLNDRLSPDLKLVIILGRTGESLAFEPNDIMHMMPTRTPMALVPTPPPQPAHS
jgi:hypothetical protein